VRIIRLVLVVIIVLNVSTSLNASSVSADPLSFRDGDLFVGVRAPTAIQHLRPDGTVVQTLATSTDPSIDFGQLHEMEFDLHGNLYAAISTRQEVVKFNSNGVLLGSIMTVDQPRSIATDSSGKVYVGTSNLSGTSFRTTIALYDTDGSQIATYFPQVGTDRIVLHMKLAADQCTMFYSTGEPGIRRFNVCTNQQLPDWATLPWGSAARGFELLADGGILIASVQTVYQLDRNGTIVRSYQMPPVNDAGVVDIAVSVDGQAFWATNSVASTMYKFSIKTGNLLNSFTVRGASNISPFSYLAIFNQSCPFKQDCDLDGLSNFDEATVTHTDPYAKDTDGDGLLDPWEVDPDPDGDRSLIPGAGFNLDDDPEIEVLRDEVFGPYGDDKQDQTFNGYEDGRIPPRFTMFVRPPDPLHKDIFFEMDWQDCTLGGCPDHGFHLDTTHHAPSPAGIRKVQETFAQAPVTNPNGSTGIKFHILIDEGLQHQPNCDQGESAIRNQRFGTMFQRQNDVLTGTILQAKARVFRYIWSGHSTERNDTESCDNPSFFEFFSPDSALPFYDYSPFGDAHVGGADILVSLGPLWICPSYNTTFGATTCFKNDGFASDMGIFPREVNRDEAGLATRKFDWPLHAIVMQVGDTEASAIARLWSRSLMHLIGHSLGLSDSMVRNDPRIYHKNGELIGTEPELYTNWTTIKYAPDPTDPGSDIAPESYPPQELTVAGTPGYPEPRIASTPASFYANLDIDQDGVRDGIDNCLMGIKNPDQADLDQDGRGDACDYDLDGDGQQNAVGANMPPNPDALPYDTDNDGVDNTASADDDGDGISDGADNCSLDPNSDQLSTDHDELGDACDEDDDNDTFADLAELESGSNPLSSASKPEYIGAAASCADNIDNDGDGQMDNNDPGCIDTDNDSLADSGDNCPTLANYGWSDRDNDGIGDICDPTPLPPNTAPTASITGTYSVDEGATIDVSANGTDPETASLRFLWDLNNDDTFGSVGQRVMLDTKDLAIDGPAAHPISVQIVDEGELSATATTTVTVRNLPPVVGSINAPARPIMVGSLLMTSASFTDPGVRDTHTAIWDWGDGTTTQASISELKGAGTAKGSHIYTTAGRYTVKLTVKDDDQASTQVILQDVVVNPLPVVEFSTVDHQVPEYTNSVLITVLLRSAATEPVTVNYASSNGTATAGSDYTATSGTLTFAPGETTKTFSVPITNDTADEADEIVNLTLTDPVYATLGPISNTTITIEDDDVIPSVAFDLSKISVHENVGAVNLEVELQSTSVNTITVDYGTTSGTATPGSDYTATSGTLTFAPGELRKSFSLPILEDTYGEANETIVLALSNPVNATLGSPAGTTLTINANDTLSFSGNVSAREDAGAATITVRLNAPSSNPVTVDYASSDGTATAGSDYTATSGTLTFAPGETTKTFSVPIIDDALGEANETVTLALSNPAHAVLSASPTATLTINANDLLSFSTSTYRVSESNASATITVRLNGPSNVPVSVDYASSDGTATAGSDYTATSGTLTFAPGETTKTFAVPFVNDSLDELNETLTVALSNPSSATLGAPASAVLTIVDND
jgi:hypothetical protein